MYNAAWVAVAALCLVFPEGAQAKDRAREPAHWSRPIVYSLGVMLAGYAIFVPLDVWEDPARWEKYQKSWSEPPRRDANWFWTNYVGHPLWGSETYLKAREANYGFAGSLIFSTAMSFFWEYVIEGWHVHPSLQDLVSTPCYGFPIGEARYLLMNKLDDKHDWWLDPIDTTLQHLWVFVARNERGDDVAMLRVTYEF